MTSNVSALFLGIIECNLWEECLCKVMGISNHGNYITKEPYQLFMIYWQMVIDVALLWNSH